MPYVSTYAHDISSGRTRMAIKMLYLPDGRCHLLPFFVVIEPFCIGRFACLCGRILSESHLNQFSPRVDAGRSLGCES